MTIGILGAGHLGTSIIKGLLNSGKYQKKDFKIVVASDDSIMRLQKQQLAASKNWRFLANCQIIILALCPSDINQLKTQLTLTFNQKQVIISVAAGITLAKLAAIFPHCLITRVMPNLACQFNQAMTMICKEGNEIANQQAAMIFQLLGKIVILPEAKIHVFIAICASAIAYPYYWLAPLMTTAWANDISKEDSKLIIANMLIGAATEILDSGHSLQTLQKEVIVAGGTTIAAIKVFEQYQVKNIIDEAISAVINSSKNLG